MRALPLFIELFLYLASAGLARVKSTLNVTTTCPGGSNTVCSFLQGCETRSVRGKTALVQGGNAQWETFEAENFCDI